MVLSDKVNISSGVSINSTLPLQIFFGSALGLKAAFGDFLVLISILNVELLESTDSNNLECCFSDLSEQYRQKWGIICECLFEALTGKNHFWKHEWDYFLGGKKKRICIFQELKWKCIIFLKQFDNQKLWNE